MKTRERKIIVQQTSFEGVISGHGMVDRVFLFVFKSVLERTISLVFNRLKKPFVCMINFKSNVPSTFFNTFYVAQNRDCRVMCPWTSLFLFL